ncbi:MAG: hypothetical protein IH937_05585 [Acidobacteria bacterium]|nr:hypothetical protein [Acidobacteriota bacterium]
MILDKHYRLISDDFNFILQRKVPIRSKKRAGKTKEWRNVGYWRDLGQALASYARQSIRDDMPSTLNKLLALERALGAQIEAIGERCVSLWGKGS